MGYCETHSLDYIRVRHCPRCPEPDRSWLVRGLLMYAGMIPGRHRNPKRSCDAHRVSFDKPSTCRACLGIITVEAIESVRREHIDDLLREIGA